MSLKNYIGISRDHSVSMRGITSAAMTDYNSTLESIRDLAIRDRIATTMSVVVCGAADHSRGYSGHGRVEWDNQHFDLYSMDQVIYGRDLPSLPTLRSYEANGGSTPLFDSVGQLIEYFESRPDVNHPDVSFLIMAITDGEENSSLKWSAAKLRKKMQELENRGNWTFTFRVPRGYADQLSRQFGISRENILEWETTKAGMEESTAITRQSFDTYYTARSTGVRSTKKFFVNPGQLKTTDVIRKLDDISHEVSIFQVGNMKQVIKPFIEDQIGSTYIPGTVFYELVKNEKHVQDYKAIVIRDISNGKVYAGSQARQLLGLPEYGDVSVDLANFSGKYQIFIQSTSVNRNLPPYTNVLFWPNVRRIAA